MNQTDHERRGSDAVGAGGAEALEKQCGLTLFVLRCFVHSKRMIKPQGLLRIIMIL